MHGDVYDYHSMEREGCTPTKSEDFSVKPSRKVRVLAA